MRQISIAMAVLLGMPALTPAWVNAQVHRCIEKDGTLVYSDKPCLNESSRASTSQARTAPASKAKTGTVAYSQDARVFKELQGTWSVASAKRNGTSHVDQKWIGSEWIFRADTLYLTVERPSRHMREYTVAVDAGAEPKVLHLAAESAGEKSGWMLFSRVGGALRIAFYDNLERRPKSFDVTDGLLTLQLIPRSGLPPVAADDGCGILRAAGAYDLLGDSDGSQRSQKYPNGGFECRAWRQNSVHLTVIPAREDEFEYRLKTTRHDSKYPVQAEAGFAVKTYSIKSEQHLQFIALKGGKLIQLNFHVRDADPAQLRRVFSQVLDRL